MLLEIMKIDTLSGYFHIIYFEKWHVMLDYNINFLEY